jgi:sigma-B regulation protein RsbU (phosphoserine phosphatase)
VTGTGVSELDVVPCGLLQTLDDGTIRRANRMFAEWVGVPSASLAGQRFQDLLTVGGRIFHQTHWAPLIRMQGSISEVKLELMHNGGAIPIVVNAIRRDDGTGTIVHEIAAFVARDRDRYEQELVRSRRRLEDAVAELSVLNAAAKDRAQFAEQMMGIVSHDLRNPLSAIRLGADLLSMQMRSEAEQRTIGRIVRATERASRLIDDLLDFTSARVGSGINISMAPIRLHDVIGETLDELRHTYPSHPIVHRREGGTACRGDGRRLVQLVGNLVSNAIAYGSVDRPVTVTTRVSATSCIGVHNEGAPIPEEIQASMFRPMARGKDAGAERSVGLGLFIVREIARAHSGSASVKSSTAGTTFTVEWPST